MADISKIVDYGKKHTVNLIDPINHDPIGISFDVVSIKSPVVIKAIRAYERDVIAKRAAGEVIDEDKRADDGVVAWLTPAVVGWDFKGQSFGEIGEDPEFTPENLNYVLTHPNGDWIRDQIAAGCAAIENFTNPLPKSVKTTSKRK